MEERREKTEREKEKKRKCDQETEMGKKEETMSGMKELETDR